MKDVTTKPLTVTFDTAKLRERLRIRLMELGKTSRGASREASLGESTIRNIMEGKSKSPRMDTILRLAKALEVKPAWFLECAIDEDDEVDDKTTTKLRMIDIADKVEREMERMAEDPLKNAIQLLHPSTRKDGSYQASFQLNMLKAFNDAFSPRLFHHYVFQVRNDSMWPIYRNGDELLIDRELPMLSGEDYLFLGQRSDGSVPIWLARLSEFDEEKYVARLFKPDRCIELSRASWKAERVRWRLPREF